MITEDTSVSALSFINYTIYTKFLLKQEMQQIYYMNSTSLVNNSKPKAQLFQQGLILLDLP